MNDDYPTKTMYACGHCLQSTGQPSWLCWWWSPGTVLGTPVLQQTLKSVTKCQKQTKTKQAKYVWKLSPSVKNGLKMQKVSTKIHSVHFLRKSGNSSLLPIVKKNRANWSRKITFLTFLFISGRSVLQSLKTVTNCKKNRAKLSKKNTKLSFLHFVHNFFHF